MLSQLNDGFAIESSSFCEIWKSCISKFDFQPQTMNSKSLSISSISIFFLTNSLVWSERPKLSLRRSQSSIDRQTTESLFSSSLLSRISLHWKYKIPTSSWVLVFPTFDSECSSIQCSYVWIASHMHLIGVCVCLSHETPLDAFIISLLQNCVSFSHLFPLWRTYSSVLWSVVYNFASLRIDGSTRWKVISSVRIYLLKVKKKISSASAYNILNGFPTTERNKKYCYQYLVVLMV